jgi:hypothetical protein
MSKSGLTREFLHERDVRIFKMKQAGVPSHEIGRRFGLSTQTVNAAVRRQLEKLNREALMAYPEVLRMELERLDSLQQAVWPMTQHRKIKLDDGSEVQVEPDLKAIQQVLAIMDRRSRLLGMEQTNVNLVIDKPEPQRAVLAGATENQAAKVDAFNPETEARQLLELMGSSGVLPQDVVKQLLAENEQKALKAAKSDDFESFDGQNNVLDADYEDDLNGK